MSKGVPLFRRANRPRWHTSLGLRETWWTWSGEARRFLVAYGRELESLRLTSSVVLATSYPMATVPVVGRRRSALLAASRPLIVGLEGLRLSSAPRLLRGLIDHEVTGRAVSNFGALLAHGLNELRGNAARPAMFVPPNPSPVSSDFLPHSDLFPCRRLWITYDQVRPPEWSESLLLPWSRAFRALGRIGVPRCSLERIQRLLTPKRGGDGFDDLFRLLHEDFSPRGELISALLVGLSACAPFRQGEGYLLDDRQWLHGRRKTNGGITRARFRRLVF